MPYMYHGTNSHLEPFLPYVERAPSTPLRRDWHLPHDLSKPISIATVRSWLATCARYHGQHCRRGQEVVPRDQHPAFLIDVNRACIVPLPAVAELQYATLSYVWGRGGAGGATFSLTRDTREGLLADGALNQVDLPRTIRDAMSFVATLGVRYLWVDRLCIMQDDNAHKHAQIKAMGSIYFNAHFTIIAAQSHDASGPLTSRPLRSPPPDTWSTLRTLGGAVWSWPASINVRRRIASRKNPSSPWMDPQTDRDVMKIMSADLLRSLWYSRGWTFQEFLFSRRKIIFHNNTVNWECHCTSAHEERTSLAKDQCRRDHHHVEAMGVDIDNWPDFHRFARLASLLTPRLFTYPEDVLDAFAGAANALARVYEGGLVTGIPQTVFDAALIWQPYHPMQRRKPVLVSEEEAVLPSWSWVSWRGNVQSESWQSGYDYLLTRLTDEDESAEEIHPRWSTVPTVQWHHSATLTSERHAIHAGTLSAEWRRTFEDDPRNAPWGWTSHTRPDGLAYFTYRAIPDCHFRYPIPIVFPSGIGTSRALRSRFLHCKTRHATVRAQAKPYRTFAAGCVFLALQDEDNLIGTLRLNSGDRDERQEEFWQLIELSSGSVELHHTGKDLLDHYYADIFDEWVLPSWKADNPQVYEFYNIMHVEWVSPGVATRVAVGRVEKRAWERLALEEVELSIG